MKAYTLKRRKETEEYHLFEGDFSKEPCTSVNESICKKNGQIRKSRKCFYMLYR